MCPEGYTLYRHQAGEYAMKARAVVTGVGLKSIKVSVERYSCEQCHSTGGCGLSTGTHDREFIISASNVSGLKVGQRIGFCLPQGRLGRAVGFAYGLPLLMGFLAALLGDLAASYLESPGDQWAPIGFLCGVAGSFAALRFFSFESVAVSTEEIEH